MTLTETGQPPAVVPDYHGANLATVVPALMETPGRRPLWLPGPVSTAEQVVLLVVDGLGWLQLAPRLGMLANISQLQGRPITSVVPSTTATALTSLVVGAPPASHGLVGYKVVVGGPQAPEIMNVLKWRTKSGDARSFVDPGTFQACTPFGGVSVPVVSKADFAGSGFTVAHQRGARQVGWSQVSEMAIDVARLISSGERFVYAYYDGVDRIAHAKGFSPYYDAELVALDRIVGDILDSLPRSAALVVTADHGQVEVGPNLVELDADRIGGISMISGEARLRWLHCADAEAGSPERLAAKVRDLYGHQAWVATFEEVEKLEWFGGPIAPVVRARLGDVAVAAYEPVAFVEPSDSPDSRKLVCRHGSLTPAEMFVPLVACRGRL